MKHIKKFNTHDAYTAFIVGSEFVRPNISKCVLEGEVHYNKKLPSPKLLDILYSDTNGNLSFSSEVLSISEGLTPIGICVVERNFFGKNEPTRWLSLKFMNKTTPDTGSVSSQEISFGYNREQITPIEYLDILYNNSVNSSCLIFDTSEETILCPSIINNEKWNLIELGEKNQYILTDVNGKYKTKEILKYACVPEDWRTISEITTSNTYVNGYYPAVCCCWRYHTLGTQQGDWYLPAAGEFTIIFSSLQKINEFKNKIIQIHNIYPTECYSYVAQYIWTSTLNSSSGGNMRCARYQVNTANINNAFVKIALSNRINNEVIYGMLQYN